MSHPDPASADEDLADARADGLTEPDRLDELDELDELDDHHEIRAAADALGLDRSDERLQRRADRRQLLRDAALHAELTTGAHERTEEAARRNIVLRLGTIAVGFIVLLAGVAMMVLPGPGIVVIIIGLGILARELPWAERLLEYAKKKAKVDELKEQPRWVQVAMWTGTVAAVVASMVYVFVIR